VRGGLLIGGVLTLVLSALAPGVAHADELRLHANAGLVHAVGDPQGSEYGFGAGGALAGELPIGKVLGLQIEGSALGLTQGSAPSDPKLASHGAGSAFGAMAGLRVRPLGAKRVAGLWLDVNGGGVFTGSVARPGFDAHVGYDWRLGRTGRWDVGPFAGYTHVFQLGSELRPEDAHILWLGVHIALGDRGERGDRDHDGIFDDEDACPDEPGIRTNDPKTNGCPRQDRDHDGVFDDEDACPDVPGVRTSNPATNGCPPSDRDHDGIFDTEDACPDEPGIRTTDPKTNGCPRRDRDNDGIFDDEDACPDVPGVRTTDPKTNGCPPAGDQVRLEGDKIVLGEIIHFDLDSPRVRHESWGIIKKVADFMNANPDIIEIDIEGHADESGSEEHNMVLSRDRAASVKQLLVRFGIDDKRITSHAYGESRPRVPGHAEEARRQNRRVEFTVTRSRAKPKELTPTAPAPTAPATPTPTPTPAPLAPAPPADQGGRP
jgi:OOP family OmpA-OmpF porin